jgi:hypothetical protein
MSTSANVTRYVIRRDGRIVGEHTQHALCKYNHHELLKYQPPERFTIQPHWDDEDEVTHAYDERPLAEFLQYYYDMGRRYRDGCTIEEVFTAPKGARGLPDLKQVKSQRPTQT